MTNKCELCKNKLICKYKEEYEARFKELAELDESKIRENPTFSIDLDCKYFNKEESTQTIPESERLSDSEIDKFWRDYNGIRLNTINKCEGCPTYERIKRGEVVIGDQCSFCQDSPTKVICGYTPAQEANTEVCDSPVQPVSGTNTLENFNKFGTSHYTTNNNEVK